MIFGRGCINALLNIDIQGRIGHYYIEVPPSNICKYHPCKNDGHYTTLLQTEWLHIDFTAHLALTFPQWKIH